MSRVILAPQAEADLMAITEYYRDKNPDAGIRLIRTIRDRCRQLGRLTRSVTGRPRDDIGRGIRSVVSGRYVIFFRRRGDRVDILRIVHGSRDIGPDMFPG
ncbi:MAG: type II toxin-antitoxin system RelE/ParE family toxin [Gemmataceae bacterium]